MTNYNEMKTIELKKIAQGLGIKGYASGNKAFLIPAIEKAMAPKKETKKRTVKTYNGKTLKEWSEELNMPVATLRARINNGWNMDEIFRNDNHKKKGSKLYEYNGKKQNLNAWAKELGISVHTLNARINRLGWEPEKALATKSGKKKGN